jgi:cytochrome c peroxidase
VPPPTLAREPSAIELRGKAVFERPRTGCTRCHAPATEFTDRTGTALRALPVRAGFDAEAAKTFKTPSLWFVGGTAPYFHDGSARTLEDLVRTNGVRMGDTRHLTPEEQAALVAFLRSCEHCEQNPHQPRRSRPGGLRASCIRAPGTRALGALRRPARASDFARCAVGPGVHIAVPRPTRDHGR